MNGSAPKGRKLTWINPTHIAPQKRISCLFSSARTHPEIGMPLRSEFGGLQEGHAIFGGENDVHQNKGERLGHTQLHHIYMLLLRSILRPFGASRRGGTVPGVETHKR